MVRIDVPTGALWLGVAVAGAVHLLVPGRLLRLARLAYRWLRVAFDPKPGAKRRVRLVGLALLAAGAVLRRLPDR